MLWSSLRLRSDTADALWMLSRSVRVLSENIDLTKVGTVTPFPTYNAHIALEMLTICLPPRDIAEGVLRTEATVDRY